jgi:hypothetical protein
MANRRTILVSYIRDTGPDDANLEHNQTMQSRSYALFFGDHFTNSFPPPRKPNTQSANFIHCLRHLENHSSAKTGVKPNLEWVQLNSTSPSCRYNKIIIKCTTDPKFSLASKSRSLYYRYLFIHLFYIYFEIQHFLYSDSYYVRGNKQDAIFLVFTAASIKITIFRTS